MNTLTKSWTFKRGVYSGLGLIVILSSISPIDGISMALGAYMLAMGLFGFGCASSKGCDIDTSTNKNS